MHNYEESIAEKTKSITDLERQIAAMQNDNTASTVAKRKKLEEQLAEAKKDLEETQYLVDNLNRMREDKSSNSDYEKILRNARVDKNGSIVSEKGKWTK